MIYEAKTNTKAIGRSLLNGDGREKKLSRSARRKANRGERHQQRIALREYY